MANMSYCRFENTYNDLQDCWGIIDESPESLSESEQKYRLKLIKLCDRISKCFDDAEEN
jgi:hypothetical protein